jgi:hypothetical protein
MFQELLIADLVVADLTIDNPNVWYELGVRHALRARGVVLIQGQRPYQPFDTYSERKVNYQLRAGAPDPACRADDRKRIGDVCKTTMEAWHGRKVSPVYQLVPHLQEPNWKSLRVGDVKEFWEAHEACEQRIRTAKRMGRAGDILVLAGEAPTRDPDGGLPHGAAHCARWAIRLRARAVRASAGAGADGPGQPPAEGHAAGQAWPAAGSARVVRPVAEGRPG